MDTDGDGVLTKEEVKNGMKEHIDPYFFGKTDWEAFMNSVDADKNGSIDF